MFSSVKRAAIGVSLALAVGGLALGGTSAQAAGQDAASHRQQAAAGAASLGALSYTCVTGNNVWYHNAPSSSPGSRLGQVNAGQGFNITDSSGVWRKGNLWGGPSGVWISSTYLGICN
ncbi:SH3 domain-containing protein [Streptomyces sp. H27-D2]|uniref:SH3 domain-containing protein n=1 Tax=Streptomyces sp. H27-D2 TaxID=3046304 RepID=UPI002DB78C07|nr:SH3 domain-containing protein [Streptomyces sp. H27-D2]MEC4021060.1 SH3 domain-containing protein [Streptomyces sp. H27-D2]